MKAFISWSGSRELLIAKGIKAWLAAVFPEIPSFLSPELPKGKAWFGELAKELRGARIGFICLAPPRVASDWELFEAGAIWKAATRGGLFPLSFRVRPADVSEPLQDFQSTYFVKEDFTRLATAVGKLARLEPCWTPEREQAFELSWSKLKACVDDALNRPDDGVHTTRGFIHEVAGAWWERVRSETGETKLSWMTFVPSADGSSLGIRGRGYGEDGSFTAQWNSEVVSVQAEPTEPILTYYWEGRHPSGVLFGGKGWFRFTISPNGGVYQGSGEFRDVCLEKALPPTTKLVNILKATDEDIKEMTSGDVKKRRARADLKLDDWP